MTIDDLFRGVVVMWIHAFIHLACGNSRLRFNEGAKPRVHSLIDSQKTWGKFRNAKKLLRDDWFLWKNQGKFSCHQISPNPRPFVSNLSGFSAQHPFAKTFIKTQGLRRQIPYPPPTPRHLASAQERLPGPKALLPWGGGSLRVQREHRWPGSEFPKGRHTLSEEEVPLFNLKRTE